MFMSTKCNPIHEIKPSPKQLKIPVDGQLSKKGTIIKNTKTANEVDYSIAEIIEKINLAGFISKFSCSGLKKDHPLQDVSLDGGYISFFNQDNDMESLTFIKKAALRLNMTVEQCKISRRLALVVRIDKDKAGYSLRERISLANETLSVNCCENCSSANGAYSKDLEDVKTKNGGLFYDSDEKIEKVWNRFADFLLNSRYQNAS